MDLIIAVKRSKDRNEPNLVPELAVSTCIQVLWPGQTCQLSRVTRESHGFLHFLQSHGRGNSCSRVYSCSTVLFSHRLLPIIIAGNTFRQHKFSVNETEACFLRPGSSVARPKRRSALSCLDGRFVVGIERRILSEFVTIDSTSRQPNRYNLCFLYIICNIVLL